MGFSRKLFINLYKPALNCDDKVKDDLTVTLPDVEWQLFTTHLWDKWKAQIAEKDNAYTMRKNEQTAYHEMVQEMRKM